MKKTVICHIYNEEYMLPWFLNHHKQIFDHGIIIDYHSTDRSLEIVRELCPTWDIVTSRNKDFQADNIDYEVLDIERNIEGWRICLNVTEQIIGDFGLLGEAPGQYLIPTVFFVDTDPERAVTQDLPLYKQKTNGFMWHGNNFRERRARSIHNVPVQYPIPGRHYEQWTTDKLVTFYYGWCPFDQTSIDRKLQIQTQIPLVDRQRNWGFHHITNKETLQYRMETEFLPRAVDLSEQVKYYENLSNIL